MRTYNPNRNGLAWLGSLRGVVLAAALAAVLSLPGIGSPTRVQSFCEYGTAISLEFGAAGAVWSQVWGQAPVDWHECLAKPNIGFLNASVTGLQVTRTTGAPVIDANLVLHLPFAGTIVLTAGDDEEPDLIAGTIEGSMEGTFVADLNAAHAVVTDETITVRFGRSLHADPDALITVTRTTGKFQSLHAYGRWAWDVDGIMTVLRVPELTPQQNIFAALQNSSLLLGAQEEVALSGSYYRLAPVSQPVD